MLDAVEEVEEVESESTGTIADAIDEYFWFELAPTLTSGKCG